METLQQDMETVSKRALISCTRTTIITKNFLENISKELDNLSKLEAISTRVDSLDAAIDDLQKYSFQYNVNIIGFPEQDEHESAETTTQLCLKLFHTIGTKRVTKNDIDIAHRVNSRRPDSHYQSHVLSEVKHSFTVLGVTET